MSTPDLRSPTCRSAPGSPEYKTLKAPFSPPPAPVIIITEYPEDLKGKKKESSENSERLIVNPTETDPVFKKKYLITSDKEDLNNLSIILNIKKTKNPTCISAVYFCQLETSEAVVWRRSLNKQ